MKVTPKFRGQANQDGVLWEAIFHDVTDGYFVDVGAHDGVSFSNTLAFEEIGWRGVCIEAHPDYIQALRLNRPFSDVIHAAAGPQNIPSVVLHGTPFGFLSTVEAGDVAHLDALHAYNGQGRQDYSVPMRRLDDILHGEKAPVGFELLCIDTEGYEVEVLKGITLSYWRPRVLLLEGFDTPHKDSIINYMRDAKHGAGYGFALTIGIDLVYCRDAADTERLLKWRGQIHLPA